MMKKVLVYIQQDQGKINFVSLEALHGAQKIANKFDGIVSAVTFNSMVAESLCNYDVSEVILLDSPHLETYNPLNHIKAMVFIANEESADMLVFGHTYEARDWVPRLSARLDIPFISDCINFKIDEKLNLVRSVYQGKLNSDIVVNGDKCIVSFQSGAFRVDSLKSGSAPIRKQAIDLSDVSDSIKPGEIFQDSETSVDLSQADVIVSVGRGIGKEENLLTARDLASAMGGQLASSRPIVDSGWLEPYHQIGSSGQTVTPKLYLALGISGAIQHIVGMKGSKNIVVINKDPNAPLFEIADYGVVGDLFEIVPKLISAIQSN